MKKKRLSARRGGIRTDVEFFFSLAVIDILSTAIVFACGRFITGKYRMRNTFIVASSIASASNCCSEGTWYTRRKYDDETRIVVAFTDERARRVFN